MPTLNYYSPEAAKANAKLSVAIFAPIGIAVALYGACALWFHGAIEGDLVLVALSAGEIVTIFFLCAWRRRLILFAMIAGWLLVSVVALFLAFVAAVNLGLLRE